MTSSRYLIPSYLLPASHTTETEAWRISWFSLMQMGHASCIASRLHDRWWIEGAESFKRCLKKTHTRVLSMFNINGPPRLLISTRWQCIKGQLCNLKQNTWLCSKQSSFFSFYVLPSGGKSKDAVVYCPFQWCIWWVLLTGTGYSLPTYE